VTWGPFLCSSLPPRSQSKISVVWPWTLMHIFLCHGNDLSQDILSYFSRFNMKRTLHN
jgi:hypothetical protein